MKLKSVIIASFLILALGSPLVSYLTITAIRVITNTIFDETLVILVVMIITIIFALGMCLYCYHYFKQPLDIMNELLDLNAKDALMPIENNLNNEYGELIERIYRVLNTQNEELKNQKITNRSFTVCVNTAPLAFVKLTSQIEAPLTMWNQPFLQLVKLNDEQMFRRYGNKLVNLIDQSEVDKVIKIFNEKVFDNEVFALDFHVICGDGTKKKVRSYFLYTDSKGSNHCCYGVLIDRDIKVKSA